MGVMGVGEKAGLEGPVGQGLADVHAGAPAADSRHRVAHKRPHACSVFGGQAAHNVKQSSCFTQLSSARPSRRVRATSRGEVCLT